MTRVFNDSVDVTMTIDNDEWLLEEAEVQLSQASTPNYVKIESMIPGKNVEVPNNPTQLIGDEFELIADNQLISERVTDSEEDSLLFRGSIANISATGEKSYEGIAHDPSQEPLAAPNKKNPGENGSILNQKLLIKEPYDGFNQLYSPPFGTNYIPSIILGSNLVDTIANSIPGVDDLDNQLKDGPITRSGPNGEVEGAKDRILTFDKGTITIKNAIEKVTEVCEVEYWFDKEGTLHFGVPEPVAHELEYITDASDGITTPPYQSVRVISSGISTTEGRNRSHMEPEEKSIIEATWVSDVEGFESEEDGGDGEDELPEELQQDENEGSGGGYIPVFLEDLKRDTLPEPVFTYRNNELSTVEQAKSAAEDVVKDLAKQQEQGKITVVGFPEVTPLDAIVMPQAQDEDLPNYQENMPMGGNRYAVYKVVHRLNDSDGFKTIIHIAGLTGSARVAVPADGAVAKITDRGDITKLSPEEQQNIEDAASDAFEVGSEVREAFRLPLDSDNSAQSTTENDDDSTDDDSLVNL